MSAVAAITKRKRDDPQTSQADKSISETTETKRQHLDDAEGHIIPVLGDNITPRFKILKLMGEGTFGKVLEVWDRTNQIRCALKVVRAVPKYRDAAKIEIEVLTRIAQKDPTGKYKCIHMIEWFDYQQHICMLFPKLGLSLYDFLKKNAYQPYCMKHVQEMGLQLVTAVAYMHHIRMIHTDLKPENILLVNDEYTTYTTEKGERREPVNAEIRVIDFGSAVMETDYHSSIISTRHYRAPEVTLGIGWTYPADVWSLGCILLEMYTGDAAFQTHENIEHLAMMEKMIGPIPPSVVANIDPYADKYFKNGQLNWPEKASSTKSIDFVSKVKSLEEIISPRHASFLNLIRRMLEYDPYKRISAHSSMKHPFFQEDFSTSLGVPPRQKAAAPANASK